uniref:Uncharacterized protein n=1 Tax=Rhizophora mucronata TaxID=61149 RepID=A0A2P2N6A5_RHIMU
MTVTRSNKKFSFVLFFGFCFRC